MEVDYVLSWLKFTAISEIGANVVRAHASCACEGGRSGH